MAALASGGWLLCAIALLLLGCEVTDGSGEVAVSLEMPKFASRGSSVSLHCAHNVQQSLLYKVEWLRGDQKIFQYVRERQPPFRNYNKTEGARLNMSMSNETTVLLEDLEFSATGTYTCEVSLENPLYTKASADKELIIIQPQRHPPRITFGASLYSAGELVETNCTTSPAHPAPHITWFVNGVKVDPARSRTFTRLIPLYRSRKRYRSARSRLHTTHAPHHHHHHPNDVVHGINATDADNTTRTKSCSARDVYGGSEHYHRHSARQPLQVEDTTTGQTVTHHKAHGIMAKPGAPAQRLSVTVSALKLQASGRLTLTCLATIPAYRGPSGRYGDARNHTVIVDVVVAEELEPEPTEAATDSSTKPIFTLPIMMLLFLLMVMIE